MSDTIYVSGDIWRLVFLF